MIKLALIDRLFRLGATDIPRTPRLLMRKRSKKDLAKLQFRVHSRMTKMQRPFKRALHRTTKHIPHRGTRKLIRGVGNRIIENPDALPLAALPVPGSEIAYLAAKRGIEKGIDRVAPADKRTMSALKKTASRTIFADAALHGRRAENLALHKYKRSFKGNPFVAEQASALRQSRINRVGQLGGSIKTMDSAGKVTRVPPLVKKAFVEAFQKIAFMAPGGFDRERLLGSSKRGAIGYGKAALIGAGAGAALGALKGRTDALSYVTYHKLSEKDKKKMRRARMLSTAAGGAARGATTGLFLKALHNEFKKAK